MLTLTEAASRKLAEIMSTQAGPVVGLRVFVQKGGCSGYSYGMTFADAVNTGDWVGEFGGVKVMVDEQSAPILNGVRIDYVETLQQSGFAIENPNARRTCGCGNSFETEGEAAEGSLPGEMSV